MRSISCSTALVAITTIEFVRMSGMKRGSPALPMTVSEPGTPGTAAGCGAATARTPRLPPGPFAPCSVKIACSCWVSACASAYWIGISFTCSWYVDTSI